MGTVCAGRGKLSAMAGMVSGLWFQGVAVGGIDGEWGEPTLNARDAFGMGTRQLRGPTRNGYRKLTFRVISACDLIASEDRSEGPRELS
jgi:hypothetical protein